MAATGLAVFDGVNQPKLIVEVASSAGPAPADALVLGGTVGLGAGKLGATTWTPITSDCAAVSIPPTAVVAGEPATPTGFDVVINDDTGSYDPESPTGPWGTLLPTGATASDTQPVLFDTVDGLQSASSSGCTNSVVFVVNHQSLLTDDQARLVASATGWNAGIATSIVRTTSQALTGPASLQLTKTTGAGTILANTNAPDIGQGAGIGAQAGKTYTAIAKFRAQATARSCQLRLICYNVSNTNIAETTGSSVTDATTGWTDPPAVVSMAAPAGTTQLAVEVQVSGAALGEVHYATHVDVHEGTDTEFVPGGVTFPANGSYHDMGGASAPSPNGTSPATPAGTTTFWGDVAGTFASCRWQLRPDLDPSGVGAGYFWSNQGFLEAAAGGAGNKWYFGLQANGNVPTPSFVGKTINFSVWGAVAAIAGEIPASYAGTFTGEGDGYRIAAPFAWTAGRTYTLLVGTDEARGPRWYRAFIRDEATSIVTWVGSIQAGTTDSSRLRGVSYQFSELFAQTSPAGTCPLLPRSTTYFSTPTFSQSAPGATIDLDLVVRVRSEWPLGTVHQHAYGIVDDIDPDDAPPRPTVTLKCLDMLARLARDRRPAVPVPQWSDDLTGTRLGRLADAAGWPSSQRQLDAGLTMLAPTVLGEFTLTLMDQAVRTEYGWLFADPAGNLVFFDRYHLATATRSTTVQATIADTGSMSALRRSKGHDRFWNDVALTRAPIPNPPDVSGQDPAPDQPVEQVATDFTSTSRFEVWSCPQTVGELHRSDADMLVMAQWLAPRFATPATRVEQVNATGLGFDEWSALLELRRGDLVRVVRTKTGVAIDRQLIVEGAGMDARADGKSRSWDFAFLTGPVPAPRPASALVLGGSVGLGTATLEW